MKRCAGNFFCFPVIHARPVSHTRGKSPCPGLFFAMPIPCRGASAGARGTAAAPCFPPPSAIPLRVCKGERSSQLTPMARCKTSDFILRLDRQDQGCTLPNAGKIPVARCKTSDIILRLDGHDQRSTLPNAHPAGLSHRVVEQTLPAKSDHRRRHRRRNLDAQRQTCSVGARRSATFLSRSIHMCMQSITPSLLWFPREGC